MKKIISIFLALALFVSCFAGTLTISAEDTAVSTGDEMLFGIEVPVTGDYKAAILEAKALGSNIVRITEPDDHDYNQLLKVITYAEQHGMEILLNCDHINYEFLYDSAASEAAEKRLPYATAEDVDVAAVTEHYTTLVNAVNGRVDYYKLGNELDNWYLNGGEQGREYEGNYLDVASAAAALGAASDAIKAVDTDAKTVINFNWLHYGFLDGLAQNGFSWDVSGIDWYSSGSYNAEYGPEGTVAQYDYGHVIDTLATNYPDKEIIICETGLTPDGVDENGGITYIGDAQWLGGMITDIKTNYADKVSAITVFKIHDPEPQTDENGAVIYDAEDYYGIIDADGNRKDTYYAVQTAFGGTDDWNIIGGGKVDRVYDTLYKAAAADTFGGPGLRVSDYAVTVGDRMMYRTSSDGWQYNNGVANGAFTYDGTTFDRFYTINPNTKNGVKGGIKYTVAANTELHIPIVVPTAALDIMDYFKFEVSSDGGETWSAVTPDVIETKAVKLHYESTMTVYMVRLYEACDFRVFFPPIWYDEEITANDHVPNGTADGINDSPYDLLYDVNSGAVTTANGIMYMLPATAYPYTISEFSYGCKDVITNNEVDGIHVDDDYVSDLISNANIYRMDNDTVYAKITGILASAPTDTTTWRWDSYGTSYASYGERVFVPVYKTDETYNVKKPFIEYNVKAGTVVSFDIGAINKSDFQKFWNDYKIELIRDNGTVVNAIAPSDSSYYTLNDKSNVRTYTVPVYDDSILRITFPDIVDMSNYIVSKDENGAYVVNDSRSYLYGEATFVSTLRSYKAILNAGAVDDLSSDYVTETHIGGNSYTVPGSGYSNVSSLRGAYDFVANPVTNSSNWTWGGISQFESVSIDGTYVYSPVGTAATKVLEEIPYIDFNVTGNTKITVPVGMYDELWTECGDSFIFEFAPFGSNEFVEISAADYEVTSETQQMAYRYNGEEVTSGNYNCTIKTYSVAAPANGVLRVKFPATFAEMISVICKYHNTGVAFISRSGAAFVVPPTAESINYGDVNGDTVIDSRDLVRAKKAVAQVEGLSFDKLAANVDDNSGVAAGDLIVMRRFLMGEIKTLK